MQIPCLRASSNVEKRVENTILGLVSNFVELQCVLECWSFMSFIFFVRIETCRNKGEINDWEVLS